MRAACLALWVAVLVAAPAVADEAWSTTETREGATYQRRAVAGSKFHEYRATLVVTNKPEEAARAVWANITDSAPSTVKRRDVLSRSPDELVVYEQIHAPVVSDRDVTLRFVRRPVDGGFEITFQSANQLGPGPATGFVRLPMVRGKWLLLPGPDGTHATYECYSEPGGSIPAFLVRGTQQSQVVRDVDRAMSTLQRAH